MSGPLTSVRRQNYGPDDVTVCREKSPPSLRKEIVISGALAGGDHSLKVATATATPSQGDVGRSGAAPAGDAVTSIVSTQQGSSTRASASDRPQAYLNDETSAASAVLNNGSNTSPASQAESASSGISSSPWFWAATAAAVVFLTAFAAVMAKRRGATPSSANSLRKGASTSFCTRREPRS